MFKQHTILLLHYPQSRYLPKPKWRMTQVFVRLLRSNKLSVYFCQLTISETSRSETHIIWNFTEDILTKLELTTLVLLEFVINVCHNLIVNLVTSNLWTSRIFMSFTGKKQMYFFFIITSTKLQAGFFYCKMLLNLELMKCSERRWTSPFQLVA